MQSVRYFMREVGSGTGMKSAIEFANEVEYGFLSDGYEIWRQIENEIYDERHSFLGYRVFLTLVKNMADDESRKPAVAKKPKSLKGV